MPGSIFQDDIKEPRYTPAPSNRVVDTSAGDFLTGIAPAVGEVVSGRKLSNLEEQVASDIFAGEGLGRVERSTQAQLETTLSGRQEAMSRQDQAALAQFDAEVATLEKTKAAVGPRAVEIATRLEAAGRDFISRNPHLAVEAKNRLASPAVARLAKEEETRLNTFDKKIEELKVKYNDFGAGATARVLDRNAMENTRKELKQAIEMQGLDRKEQQALTTQAIQLNLNSLLQNTSDTVDKFGDKVGGDFSRLSEKDRQEVLTLIDRNILSADRLVLGSIPPNASIDFEKRKAMADVYREQLKHVREDVAGGKSVKDLQARLKFGELNNLSAALSHESIGPMVKAEQVIAELTRGTPATPEGAAQAKAIRSTLNELYKRTANTTSKKMPEISTLGDRTPQMLKASEEAQKKFVEAAPIVVGRSKDSGETGAAMNTMVLGPLNLLATNPSGIDKTAAFLSLNNLGDSSVLAGIKALSPVEREKYATAIDKAQKNLIDTVYLPNLKKDLAETSKVLGGSLSSVIEYQVNEKGGLSFKVRESILERPGGISPDEGEEIKTALEKLNATYGPSGLGRVFENISRFHVTRNVMDGTYNTLNTAKDATTTLLGKSAPIAITPAQIGEPAKSEAVSPRGGPVQSRTGTIGDLEQYTPPPEVRGALPILEKLGKLSATFESNDNPGAVGFTKREGNAYGTYQLATNFGMPQKFVSSLSNPDWKARLQEAGDPSSEAFKKAWKEISEEDREAFGKTQEVFAYKEIYAPTVRALEDKIGTDIEERSDAFKQVVWSTAVQHGPEASKIIITAFKQTKDKENDKEFIKNIYTERKTRFYSSPEDVQKSVKKRLNEEQRLIMEQLA